MEYKGKTFEAIIATPGCGKSYLTDKYPSKFADMDEIRLFTKYDIPKSISREELERTKGERPFPKRKYTTEDIYKKYDACLKEGKTLIAAPHPESFAYFESRNIKFCFIYPDQNAKEELKQRFKARNNPDSFINENDKKFEDYLISNRNDKKAIIHYEFSKDEYLEHIIKKFGLDF